MTTHIVDTRTEIETPENVTLTFNLAGPGSRMGAFTLDMVIRIALLFALNNLIAMFVPVFGMGLPFGGLLVTMFLIEWWYGAIFEGFFGGRTPGKRAFQLRVIKDAGYPIGLYEAVLRNFLRVADILPITYGFGLICMCATKRMQRIGDLVAGTIVVHERREKLHSHALVKRKLKPLNKAECTGTFHVSERTLDVMDRMHSRRDQLSDARQDEIAEILAKPIAKRLGVPILAASYRYRLFLDRVLKTFSGTESDS